MIKTVKDKEYKETGHCFDVVINHGQTSHLYSEKKDCPICQKLEKLEKEEKMV